MGWSYENLVTKYFVSSSLYSLVMILVQMIAKLLAIYLILRAVPAINLCAFLSAKDCVCMRCTHRKLLMNIYISMNIC